MNKIEERTFDIEQTLEEFRINNLGDNFEWRKGQKEAIISTVNSYINKTHSVVIIDAPTGSGKSIIAKSISYILNAYGKKGYILASDLALQEQYEKDIKKYLLPIGSVKGVDNYKCMMNDEPISLGLCHLSGSSPAQFPCYKECQYYCARNYAANTSTSLLNYSYWLIQQNYVNQHSDEVLFDKRDFVICDECHKIVDIVQNHFSPRIDENIKEKLKKITSFFSNRNISDLQYNYKEISKTIDLIYREENKQNLYDLLNIILNNLVSFLTAANKFKIVIKKKYARETPPKDWREAARICDYIKDLHCKIEDYINIIRHTNISHLIKNQQDEKNIIFNCLQESYLLDKHFHEYCKFTVYLSATIGNPKTFLKDLNLSSANYIKIESSFDYTKSPIYFYPDRKMGYKDINNNLDWIYNEVNNILNMFPDQKGIIHTVSYDLSLKLIQNLSDENINRLIVYSSTDEKKIGLDMLKRNNNSVLIGPSILEGIDLPDDHARFIIFLKVPYLSLNDKFVSAKLKINKDWYTNKAITNILQGTGRGVRHQKDWCETFILDGNFGNLIHYNRNAFPIEFLNRIKLKQ